jgi:phosphoglycerate dehydrogenase-like enzyme
MRLAGLKREPDHALADRLGLDWIGVAADLETFLAQSDYLFLCLPLSDATHGMIGEPEIAMLPEGAYIINAARGSLVSEDALLNALVRGHLGGAALDVFSQEPLHPKSRLLEISNVIATPHIAGVTDISYSDIAAHVAGNVKHLLSGAELANRIV